MNAVQPLSAHSSGFPRAIAFLSVVLGFFMAQLDSTVVNITLPVLVDYFKTDLKTISWVANGFNLAFSVLLITFSRVADQFGRKLLFLIGIVLFVVSSFLSGISPSVNMLIFFRVIQGISAALIVPISMPLILRLFPPEKSGLVIGIWGAVAGIAGASGPALGGIITNYFNWQWIFFINIPVGIVTFMLVASLIEESFDATASRHIDWPGMLSLTAGMFFLVFALIKANDKGWLSPYILTLAAAAAAALLSFIIIELHTREPMLPMTLLRNRYFFVSCCTLFVLGAGLMCGVFFMAFFLTRIMEMSQLDAGLTVTAIPLAAIFTSALSGKLSDTHGSTPFIVCGMVMLCASVYTFSDLTPFSTRTDILWRLIFCGAAIGLALPPVVGASIRAVPGDKIGVGSGVGNMARMLGAVMGVALLVTIVTHYAKKYIPEATRDTVEVIERDPVLHPEVKEIFLAQLHGSKLTQDTRLPTTDQVVRHFEDRKTEALEGASGFKAAVIKSVYKSQINEVRRVYPEVRNRFRERLSDAFSRAFLLSSIGLCSGILLAFFCEPRRKPRRASGA